MIWALLIWSGTAFAAPATFKNSLQIFSSYYRADGGPMVTYTCDPFLDNSKANSVITITGPKGIAYGISCSGHEVTTNYHVIVKKGGKEIARHDDALMVGGDECYHAFSSAWLTDVNGDGEIDLITRFKSTDSQNPECQAPYEKDNKLSVYLWRDGKFVKSTPTMEQTKVYGRKFDFERGRP